VPRVDAFAIAGLVLRFYSNDHLPPHFPALKPGHWHVKVRFRLDAPEMIEAVSKQRPRASELKELKRLAEAHRAALQAEWDAKVAATNPEPSDE
jgi:hypothetical protein